MWCAAIVPHLRTLRHRGGIVDDEDGGARQEDGGEVAPADHLQVVVYEGQ
jgi:hypothetical protein